MAHGLGCASRCDGCGTRNNQQKAICLYPSSTSQVWTEPRWNEGELARELGEDVELYFEGPKDQFYNGPVYMATNGKPLNEGVRRIDRMFVFLLQKGDRLP